MKTSKFYFTFGSDPEFPYGFGEFVEIEAADEDEAREVFRAVFPSRPGSQFLNCSSVYTELEWKQRVKDKYYKGVEPSAVISIKKKVPQNIEL